MLGASKFGASACLKNAHIWADASVHKKDIRKGAFMTASHSAAGAQLVTMLVTFFIILIPFAIINAIIAKRKGKSAAEFGWLSVIPMVGPFVSLYLLSLTDKVLLDKVDRIIEAMSGGDAVLPKRNDGTQGEAKKFVNMPPKDF